MPTREAHLVGSLPGADPAEAMTAALEIVGPYLRSLPDGETGERKDWIASIVLGLQGHPALEVRKRGDASDYHSFPQLGVRNGQRLYGASLDLGHVAWVRDSYPQFEKVRLVAGRPDLVFQQGLPGDLDMAIFTFGATRGLRQRRAFTEATLAEMYGIAAITGPDTLFQIEVPLELILLAKTPRAMRPVVARALARKIVGLAIGAPAGTHFAVHLCLGDFNNRAFGSMRDVGPLVLLANAVAAIWPKDRHLDLIHAPFAAADHPATLDPDFYRPLNKMALPTNVRFAAGFVHESQSAADQRQIRTIIEDHLHRKVVIAAACGMGRRSVGNGRILLERTAELCEH